MEAKEKQPVIFEPLANLVRLLGEIAEITRLTDDPRLLAEFVAAYRHIADARHETADDFQSPSHG
jgi:hypothetical protein